VASSYPGSLDSFDTIASDKKTSDSVGGRTHRQMHNDLGDAVEAVQAELGTDPAGSYSTVKARLDALVAYAAKTSAYTATVADHTLNVTSGTFTLDLPAASTCTGQSLKVKNSGTGVVTLDGNSSETVDGVATFPLGPGSYVEITSTGSAWILTGGVPDTGLRNMSAATMLNGWAVASGQFWLRRVGKVVTLTIFADGASASDSGFWTIPSGFQSVVRAFAVATSSTATVVNTAALIDTAHVYSYTTATFYVTLTWITSDAWPTSLPGTAA
jgi:hypothetical protein